LRTILVLLEALKPFRFTPLRYGKVVGIASGFGVVVAVQIGVL